MAKIKMIKKNPCPYCDRAKTLLDNKGFSYEVIDLTDNQDELDAWKTKTGWKTVPMIFINDTLVGGYTDLKTLADEGKLDAMVMG
ncbi:MAG: glutaredoxin [Bdellovibrionales bacterium RIFCSPHIGHO2_01_FULL_40_29]|nr:MAG: glutaredoxin [Bdellovibrionales bacterium RIFCSPHIGHO2_01_FULL_40_29]OFZ32495.1 MAG: glutaredoxin [Bdellovibrionales bacterium RIFCSPHIGHO2_02_FULL_40_15]